MSWLDALILGIVEGLTEFLPVSSTGHLTVVEKLLGLSVNDKGVTAFTAIIQVGAIIATIVYFWSDIVRIVAGFVRGLFSAQARTEFEWRFGWAIIAGTIPIGVIGLLFQDVITGALRSLWFVAAALIVWSVVIVAAERYHSRLVAVAERRQAAVAAGGSTIRPGRRGSRSVRGTRAETDVSVVDGFIIGVVQCFALVPGVSRSGATISAGLFRGLDRTVATRLSFFLAIPALVAAGGLESVQSAGDISATVGWGPTLLGIVVSFVVAYATIAWLLRFVSSHSLTSFVAYRVLAGVVIMALLVTGVVSAT